jgi:hypothetical protein
MIWDLLDAAWHQISDQEMYLPTRMDSPAHHGARDAPLIDTDIKRLGSEKGVVIVVRLSLLGVLLRRRASE